MTVDVMRERRRSLGPRHYSTAPAQSFFSFSSTLLSVDPPAPHVPGGGLFGRMQEEPTTIRSVFKVFELAWVRVPDSEKRLSSGAISRHPREEQCRSWRGKMHRGTSRCSALLVLDETTSTEQRARVAQYSHRIEGSRP